MNDHNYFARQNYLNVTYIENIALGAGGQSYYTHIQTSTAI